MRNHISRKAGFVLIAIDKYVEKHLASNPTVNRTELEARLREALAAKQAGERCACGAEIWAIGSAEVGIMCFTCITGEAVPNADYELYGEP